MMATYVKVYGNVIPMDDNKPYAILEKLIEDVEDGKVRIWSHEACKYVPFGAGKVLITPTGQLYLRRGLSKAYEAGEVVVGTVVPEVQERYFR
jgi:hypothetical protein